MLSTQYRLRLEAICKDIASGSEVSLEDMIWAEKLAKANTSARGMIKQARRMKTNPNDSFLNNLNIGDSDSSGRQIRGFDSPDEMYDWFRIQIDQMIGDKETNGYSSNDSWGKSNSRTDTETERFYCSYGS